MTDQLLSLFSLYGLPALFLIILIASIGVPFPITLLLIVAGSFTAQGEIGLWQVLVAASTGAIAGDQIGYCLGRWGGRRLTRRITNRFGGADKLRQAEAFTRRWGGLGIFFSRWLVTLLGPWINITSGITIYPWVRFIFWDVLGEVLWVSLYVLLGKVFSDRVQELADLLGGLTWGIVGVLVTIILGWKLYKYFRTSEKKPSTDAIIVSEVQEPY